MKLRKSDRSLIAWVLYCSLLISVFACSLGHGQMAGLQLNGAGSGFCSLHAAGPALDSRFGEPAPGDAAAIFCCSCCSSFTLASVALLFGLGFWLRPQRRWRRPPESRGKLPPRHTWPSANPRASP